MGARAGGKATSAPAAPSFLHSPKNNFECGSRRYYGLRWQSEVATPLWLHRPMLRDCRLMECSRGESKAPSPLRSAGAVHNEPPLWGSVRRIQSCVKPQHSKELTS